MTEADKKIIKKMIQDAVDKLTKDMAETFGTYGIATAKAAHDSMTEVVRKEIKAATGHTYGQWICTCGKERPPYYKDPLRSTSIICTCGKHMDFKDLT